MIRIRIYEAQGIVALQNPSNIEYVQDFRKYIQRIGNYFNHVVSAVDGNIVSNSKNLFQRYFTLALNTLMSINSA